MAEHICKRPCAAKRNPLYRSFYHWICSLRTLRLRPLPSLLSLPSRLAHCTSLTFFKKNICDVSNKLVQYVIHRNTSRDVSESSLNAALNALARGRTPSDAYQVLYELGVGWVVEKKAHLPIVTLPNRFSCRALKLSNLQFVLSCCLSSVVIPLRQSLRFYRDFHPLQPDRPLREGRSWLRSEEMSNGPPCVFCETLAVAGGHPAPAHTAVTCSHALPMNNPGDLRVTVRCTCWL